MSRRRALEHFPDQGRRRPLHNPGQCIACKHDKKQDLRLGRQYDQYQYGRDQNMKGLAAPEVKVLKAAIVKRADHQKCKRINESKDQQRFDLGSHPKDMMIQHHQRGDHPRRGRDRKPDEMFALDRSGLDIETRQPQRPAGQKEEGRDPTDATVVA